VHENAGFVVLRNFRGPCVNVSRKLSLTRVWNRFPANVFVVIVGVPRRKRSVHAKSRETRETPQKLSLKYTTKLKIPSFPRTGFSIADSSPRPDIWPKKKEETITSRFLSSCFKRGRLFSADKTLSKEKMSTASQRVGSWSMRTCGRDALGEIFLWRTKNDSLGRCRMLRRRVLRDKCLWSCIDIDGNSISRTCCQLVSPLRGYPRYFPRIWIHVLRTSRRSAPACSPGRVPLRVLRDSSLCHTFRLPTLPGGKSLYRHLWERGATMTSIRFHERIVARKSPPPSRRQYIFPRNKIDPHTRLEAGGDQSLSYARCYTRSSIE